MSWVQAFAIPDSIPADAVELLRHLVSVPETREAELESWIRKYPQVINARPTDLYPKTKFTFGPGRVCEPDVLYREIGSSAYDIVELKRANMPLVRQSTGPGMTLWRPSSPPRPSTELVSAVSQLNIYLVYSQEFRDYLEGTLSIRIFYPRGFLIAGTDQPNLQDDLRLIKHELPRGIRLITWTALLNRAEDMAAHRVLVSFPSVPAWRLTGQETDFLAGLNRDVAHLCHCWTGFGEPLFEPLRRWKELLESGYAEIAEIEEQPGDEGWNIFQAEQASVLGPIFYKLGKYSYAHEFEYLSTVLPKLDLDFSGSSHSLVTMRERMKQGFEDTQKWIQLGEEASSIDKLRELIEEVIEKRRRKPDSYFEPEAYYRRVLTVGFLRAKLANPDILKLLRLADWAGPVGIG